MMMKRWQLLVVIINYKTPDLVCDALASLEGEVNTETEHVVVVDNNSQDGSLAVINEYIVGRGYGGWVSIVAAEFNGGFSYGNNIGIKFAKADYYLLLNSDAYVHPQAIPILLDKMKEDERLGIAGPRLEWPDGSQQVSCFRNLTPLNSFLNAVKIGFITRFLGRFNVQEVAVPLDQHGAIQPEWLSFACVMLRGSMVRDIGLMDEAYFMYREDNDYCRRAIQAGWGLMFEPKSRVVHLNKGDSNQTALKRLPNYYFESRSRYFSKYYGKWGLLAANILWSMGRCISLFREFVQRRPKAFHSTMLSDIWIGFSSQVRKK
ncbi:MAG: glycosyltransferase family 2 protein [Gammaproteobacteria bacterium]